MKNRYLFFSFLAFILGILCALICDFNVLFSLIPCIIGLPFILIKRLRLIGFLSVILAFGLFYSGCLFFEPEKSFLNATVKGKVTLIEQTDYDYRILIENCEVSLKQKESVEKIYVYCEFLPENLNQGNIIECSGDVLPIKEPKHANPGGISSRLTSQIDGVFYYARTKKLTVLENTTDVNHKFTLLRNKIRQHIYTCAPSSDSASVLYAMITADRQFVTDETRFLFSETGTSHLLAVSGLHINILISFIAFFLKRFNVKNVISLLILGTFLIFFSFFTGFMPSVLRAGIMAIVFSFALNFGTRYDSVNILSLAGILILVCNPFILFDASFQLSFLACFGIFVFIKYQIKTKYKLLNSLFNSCIITFGATVFTLPLQVYYFGSLPLFSIIANLIVVPLASFSLMLGFMFLLISFFFNPVGILIKIPGFIIEGVLFTLKYLSKLPSVTFKAFSLIFVLIILFIFILLTRFFRFKKLKLIALLLILCLLFTCCYSTVSLNTIKIRVPQTDGTLCAHIEGKGVYVFGLSGITGYLIRSAPMIDCLFLLNNSDIKALDKLSKSIEIDKIYLHPDLKHTLVSIKHKATLLKDKIQVKDGLIYPLNSGFVFENGANSFFIGSKSYGRIYTVAITNDNLVRAKTVIAKGIKNNNCKKYYDIKINGYTYLIFRRYNESYRLF